MQQDTETTSSLSKCDLDGHISKMVNINLFTYQPEYYGCTRCDARSDTQWPDFGQVAGNPDHTGMDDCNCFGCKIKTLELNAGDARSDVVASGTTQKKWDSELNFYKQARADGIQPEGTNRAAIEKAYKASEVLNKPYDGGTMPKAAVINKSTAEVMKEVGAV